MPDFHVTDLHLGHHVTILRNCENILEARDKFARQKGYEDWGNMVVSFKRADNDLRKPPYSFQKVVR